MQTYSFDFYGPFVIMDAPSKWLEVFKITAATAYQTSGDFSNSSSCLDGTTVNKKTMVAFLIKSKLQYVRLRILA